jgi:hypothetical protein
MGMPAVYDPSEIATAMGLPGGGERVPGAAWMGAGLPFMAAGFPGPGGVTGAVTSKAPGAATGAAGGKLSSVLVPSVLNYDALSQQLGGGLSGLGGGHTNSNMLPGGAGGSVPSIQSGTLVLSGAAAFGLEGTSLGGNSLGALGTGLRPPSGRRTTMPAAPGGGSSSGKEGAFLAGLQNLTMGGGSSGGSPGGSRRLRATGSLGSYGR